MEYRKMKVHEFVSNKIAYIDLDKTVYNAVEIMVDLRVRALVVRTPGIAGRAGIHGVITARDVVFKVLAKEIDPKTVKVSEIDSSPIICIDKNTPFHEVAATMGNANIATVYVCDGGEVIGSVSLLDVMAAELVMRARGKYGS